MIEFDRNEMREVLGQLAAQGVFIGTSSWKYAGWCGQLYSPERYQWNGKLAEKRFERDCLAEYAEVFRTVCVDAAYYKFPDGPYLERLAAQVPDGFRFSFKVTDEITIKRFTNLPRFAARAGQLNPNFLNAELFASAFLGPMQPVKDKVGVILFEFSRFYKSDFERGREFMELLDQFLGGLPTGWRYGVELRNRQFLHSDYFAMLARHGVAHVYNSWTGMPSVNEQLALPGSATAAFSAARFLLRPGRTYQAAVQEFGPYNELKDIYEEARAAAVGLMRRATDRTGREEAYIYVNNRLEGNALASIRGMVSSWSAGAVGNGTG
jgi:uncharacterized protein YecE (DUF72 family)